MLRNVDDGMIKFLTMHNAKRYVTLSLIWIIIAVTKMTERQTGIINPRKQKLEEK